MPAYVVATIDAITDAEAYAKYVAQVEATLLPFGGRFLARVPGPHALEGTAPSRAVVLGFPSEAEARAWHASPAYQPVMKLRQRASTATLLVLPGYAPGGVSRVAMGDVCYIEHVTPEIDATRALFERVHGWRFEAPRPELGAARVATLASGARLAIRAPMGADEKQVTRTYVRVPDLDAAAKGAAQQGGMLALPSMDIEGQGRIAIYVLGELEFGLWEMP